MKMTNDATIEIIMTCKGVCTRLKAPVVSNANRYSAGQKRCQVCEIFKNWDGLCHVMSCHVVTLGSE
jgi:hypothetical protein